MKKLCLLILFLFIGCESLDDDDNVDSGSQIFITLQDSDYIAVVGSNTLEILDTIKVDLNSMDMSHHDHEDGMHEMSNEAPHDVAVDGQNKYWFTTAMMGNHVGMYSTETNELLSSYPITQMPALLSVDIAGMKIYVSRGKPEDGEGGIQTNIIYELSYESGELVLINEWPVQFNYAHGIHFDPISGNVFVVSKTNDWLAKIDPSQEPSVTNPLLYSMDSETAPTFDEPWNRLKPIHITSKYPYMFITCSAGPWTDFYTQITENIPGQVQMWHMEDMILLATAEFDLYSRPWHLEVSPSEDKVFVALAGGSEDSESDSGVACLEFSAVNQQYALNEVWKTTSSSYDTIHGITVEADCDGNYFVYATGREDGTIYKFDPYQGIEINSNNLSNLLIDDHFNFSGDWNTAGIDINSACEQSCCD